MAELLRTIAAKTPAKPASHVAFQRYSEQDIKPPVAPSDPSSALCLREFKRQVQQYLDPTTELLVETGDSWFIGQYMKLPAGAHYHMQMQYGSIGWAVGATLGIALALGDQRRVLALIGDGSFQVSAQEASNRVTFVMSLSAIFVYPLIH